MENSSLCDALVADLKPLLDAAEVECALLAGDHVALTADATPEEIKDTFSDASLLIVAGSQYEATVEKYQRDIVKTAWGHNLWGGVRIASEEEFTKWGGKYQYFGSGVPVKEIYSKAKVHAA